jgi:redox-sensitive bicupin YhaK (pirin superfamily)
MESGAKWVLPKATGSVNRTLFFYKGKSVTIDDQEVKSYHSVTLNSDTDIEILAGMEDTHFLFLQGKPINESVTKYGPFVMNTELEIQQAFTDYQRTQFGGWPWSRPDQVHDKNNGRFAIHADGREERK